MALIAMAIHDTEDNGRDVFTERTLASIDRTVDFVFSDHRFFAVINAATPRTRAALEKYHWVNVIQMPDNVGTAKAVNQAWKLRRPGEHAVKMDNDVVISQPGWVEQMQEAIARDPKIGIIGLKRIDCCQNPKHPEPFYASKLKFVPDENTFGRPWIVVEETADVMGTCTMFNSALLYKIGFLYQPGLYGFDDVLACVRSIQAGHYNCFLHGFHIDHIDPGGTVYQDWKGYHAMRYSADYHRLKDEYQTGKRPLWCNADY